METSKDFREIYELALKDPEGALKLAQERGNPLLEEAVRYKETYRREGVVVLRSIVPENLVKRSLEDIWDHVVNGLPWKEPYKKKWAQIRETFREDPLREITKKESEAADAIYPMTGGFGALTMPGAFHLKTQWEIRQDPLIVDIAKDLLGVEKVMCSLDRVSWKFKGQGKTEFSHWDSDPYEWPNEEYEGFQGIVALSETSFYAVPRTHTPEFREKFILNYPSQTRHDQYLISKDHDPLGLRSKAVEYSLKPGDYVIWSNRLLHEARKNMSSRVRYAYFIQYFPWGKPPKEVKRAYKKSGKTFLEDRKFSYETGANPLFFPSGTPINLHSHSAVMYHPEKLNEFTSRFDIEPGEYIYKSGKKMGQTVKIPKNYEPRSLGLYEPPPLTALGRELLGIDDDD